LSGQRDLGNRLLNRRFNGHEKEDGAGEHKSGEDRKDYSKNLINGFKAKLQEEFEGYQRQMGPGALVKGERRLKMTRNLQEVKLGQQIMDGDAFIQLMKNAHLKKFGVLERPGNMANFPAIQRQLKKGVSLRPRNTTGL
jgi:hypothetical protein